MSRSREVVPEITRLYLADVHQRAHAALVETHADLIASAKATPEDITASEAKLTASEDRVAAALEDGDYIDVKRRLNAGETRKTFTRLVKTMVVGDKPELDPEQIGKAKALEYLIGWSFIGAGDKPIPYSVDMPEEARAKALDKIEPEAFADIIAAIDAHEVAMEAESVARKKNQAGTRKSSRTSSSPDGLDMAESTSSVN
jgi:hypothetical protein